MKKLVLQLGERRNWGGHYGVPRQFDKDGNVSFPLAVFELEVDDDAAESLIATAKSSLDEGPQAFNVTVPAPPPEVVPEPVPPPEPEPEPEPEDQNPRKSL